MALLECRSCLSDQRIYLTYILDYATSFLVTEIPDYVKQTNNANKKELPSPEPNTNALQMVAAKGPPIPLQRPLLSCFRHGLNYFLHTNTRKTSSWSLYSPPKPNPSKLDIMEAVNRLELTSSAADAGTYTDLIETCTRSKLLREGKIIHRHIFRHGGHVRNPSLLEKLTCFYISCGELEVARHLFDKIHQPSIFLWNSMIRAYSWNGPLGRAIDLYFYMIGLDVMPNKFTFPFVLKACSGLKALEDGMEIHRQAERIGLDSDVFVSTALIDMYMKCGRLEESHLVFHRMPHRDIVAWNTMVAGCSLHGLYNDATGFFREMQNMGVTPNSSTTVSILPVIAQTMALAQVKSMHGFCLRRAMEKEDVLVGTALLDAYGKCEYIDYAQRVFYAMDVKNGVTWSAMIGAYVLCDRMVEALQEFNQLILEGPCNLTSPALTCVLRACAKLTDLNRGKLIHNYLNKAGFSSDITVGNTLLSMYTKCSSIDNAVEFFNEMELKDTVSYSAIISGCVQNGNAQEALLIFRKMQLSNVQADIATMAGVVPACSHLAALKHGKCSHGSIVVHGFSSDTSICNALIDMYAKCGKIDCARKVFDRMMKRDIVTWNSIIVGYGIHGLGNEALLLFSDLQATGQKPDDVTFICLLSACSHSGLVSEGRRLFHAMTETFNIALRMEHYVCMVDLLGRAGFIDEAQNFIQGMPIEPDVHVWGALLGACRVHRNIELAEKVSREIQILGPEGTGNFVLLSNIYSSAGRFDEAANVRIMQKQKGFQKSPGCSWIEICGKVHAFVGGDRSHPQALKIYEKLRDLVLEMNKLGYQADTSFVLQNVEEEEKENALLYHSEKLAIAFGIISLGAGQPIFVTKNLRVCGDCHAVIRFITMITKRAISVRDASRFHHFKDGVCNCGDFW